MFLGHMIKCVKRQFSLMDLHQGTEAVTENLYKSMELNESKKTMPYNTLSDMNPYTCFPRLTKNALCVGSVI